MENKETMKKGEILEDGVSGEFWQVVSNYISVEISKVSEEILKGDFDDLKKLYFLKGQLIGLAKPLSYPKMIIKHKKSLEKEAKEKKEK